MKGLGGNSKLLGRLKFSLILIAVIMRRIKTSKTFQENFCNWIPYFTVFS